jgi:hypothetical protein
MSSTQRRKQQFIMQTLIICFLIVVAAAVYVYMNYFYIPPVGNGRMGKTAPYQTQTRSILASLGTIWARSSLFSNLEELESSLLACENLYYPCFQLLTIIGTVAYQLNSGSPAIIYLVLNKSLRRASFSFFSEKWSKITSRGTVSQGNAPVGFT